MASEDDPYLWLEEIESDAALAWVAEQNEKAIKQLESDKRYQKILDETPPSIQIFLL